MEVYGFEVNKSSDDCHLEVMKTEPEMPNKRHPDLINIVENSDNIIILQVRKVLICSPLVATITIRRFYHGRIQES
jgi:hypothetical protein